MIISIISDIHDNWVNLDKFLKYAKDNKISEIICLGDLTSNITLERLIKGFKGKIHLVSGNVDFFNENYINSQTKKQIKYYGQRGDLEISGKKTAFVHLPWKAKALAKTGDFDCIFYGHSHKPWQETIRNCKLLNPGNLAGLLYKATFAIWDTEKDKFRLILLDEL